MRLRRRWVIGSLVGVGALGALAVGVAVASPLGDGEKPRDRIIERAAGILGLEAEKLNEALVQATADLSKEKRDAYLQKLVDAGTITAEERDQIKAWLDSMPAAVKKLPAIPKLPFGHGPLMSPHKPILPAPLLPGEPRLGGLREDLLPLFDQLAEEGILPQEKVDELRKLFEGKLSGEIEIEGVEGIERFKFDEHEFIVPRRFGPRFHREFRHEFRIRPDSKLTDPAPVPET
jgi:hypothetical protein